MNPRKEKVIFDTNIIRNTEPKTFLGGRNELYKFYNIADIIFPDVVIEELRYQKIRQLIKHKESFISNPFSWLMGIQQKDVVDFDIDTHLKSLEQNEDIKYATIKITNYSVLEDMKLLSLRKLPPFEDSDKTDKGFKDACIYFSILEYLKTISDQYVFVYTGDGRLKEALVPTRFSRASHRNGTRTS